MQRTGTKRLVIKKEGVELELEREDKSYGVSEPTVDLMDDNPMKHEMALHRASMLLTRGGEMVQGLPSPSASNSNKEPTEVQGSFIKSPMVGTFYSATSPDDPPLVRLGDKIEKDTVVCIIEAMKVMNEVKAGIAGTVAEVLVENAHPVEFGTKLFRII